MPPSLGGSSVFITKRVGSSRQQPPCNVGGEIVAAWSAIRRMVTFLRSARDYSCEVRLTSTGRKTRYSWNRAYALVGHSLHHIPVVVRRRLTHLRQPVRQMTGKLCDD